MYGCIDARKALLKLRIPLYGQGGTHDLYSTAEGEVGEVFLVACWQFWAR